MSNTTAPRRWSMVATVVLLAGALLAGCSDPDSTESASMRSGERPEVGAPGDADSGSGATGGGTEPGPDEGGSDGDGTEPEDDTGGSEPGRAGDVEAFCDRVERFDGDATEDPQALLDWLESLREVAPGDIVDDLDIMIDMIERLASIDEEDVEALGELFETLLDPKVQEASENVGDFAIDECGIDLEGDIDTGTIPGG